MKIKFRIISVIMIAFMFFNISTVFAADVSGVSSLAPKSSFNPFIDNQKIADTLFFGVWLGDSNTNGTIDGWRIQYHPLDKDANNPDNPDYKRKPIKALLQYDRIPELKSVENAVKEVGTSGDYRKAKEELLKYYKNKDIERPTINPIVIDPKWNNSSYEGVWAGYGWSPSGSEVEVTNKEQWYRIPVSSVKATYVLFAIDKIGCDFLMYGAKSDKKPYLQVTTSAGRTETIEANAGTYIRAGVFNAKNYSNEQIYKLQEDGSPVSDYTSRPYLRFDGIGDYNFDGYSAAYLYFYGNLDTTDNNKKLRITQTTASITTPIERFTWGDETITEWNYTDQMFDRYDIFDFSPPPNATNEWINGCSRMSLPFWKARAYLGTKDERYAFASLSAILTYYQTRSEWQPRVMDASWRSDFLKDLFYALLDANYLNGETCTMLLKMMEYTIQLNKYAEFALNNQGSGYVAAGILLASHFKELITEEYWQGAVKRATDLHNLIVFKDYQGYIEAVNGSYAFAVTNNIATIIKCLRDYQGEQPDEHWYDKLDNMLRFVVDQTWPNGMTPNHADDGGLAIAPTVLSCATVLNKDAIRFGYTKYIKSSEEYLYIASQGKLGTKPEHTSVLIPKNRVWMMRNTLIDPNGLALFGTNNMTSYHSHFAPLNIDVYGYGKLLLREIGSREYAAKVYRGVLPYRVGYHNSIAWKDDQNRLRGFFLTDKVNETVDEWATTNTMDYVEATTSNPQIRNISKSITRKVIFLKELGFWVVSDIVKNTNPKNTKNYTFTQTWSPNLYHNAKVDPDTKAMRTNYEGSANIFVVPADPDELGWVSGIDRGDIEDNKYNDFILDVPIVYDGTPFSYQLIDFTPSTKLMYEKQQKNGGDTSFDTVLYPVKRGDNETTVSVDRLLVTQNGADISKEKATALKINVNTNEHAYYYNSQDKSLQKRIFGDFSTDGNVAVVYNNVTTNKTKLISLIKGMSIVDENKNIEYIKSNKRLNDITISFNGQIVDVQSSEDISTATFHFYCPEKINKVMLNGKESSFVQKDNYVYIPNDNVVKFNVRNIFVDKRPVDDFLQEKSTYDYMLTTLSRNPEITIDTDETYEIIMPQSLPGVAKITVYEPNNQNNRLEYFINLKASSILNVSDIGAVAMTSATSDYEQVGFEATKTMDNNLETAWKGHGGNQSYLLYKAIRPVDVNAVSMLVNNNGKFKVEVSQNGRDWLPVIAQRLPEKLNEIVKYDFSEVQNIQYIKITFMDNMWYQVPWVSIWGIENGVD